MSHPNEKVTTDHMGVVTYNTETQAEIHLSHLSPEVLRDLARNEAASKEWRKAAVELLLEKKHSHANHPELRQLVFEIKAEREAKVEVEALAAQSPENEQVLVLDAEASKQFVEAVVNPPKPNKALKQAAEKSASNS
jgi:hypothetical protein